MVGRKPGQSSSSAEASCSFAHLSRWKAQLVAPWTRLCGRARSSRLGLDCRPQRKADVQGDGGGQIHVPALPSSPTADVLSSPRSCPLCRPGGPAARSTPCDGAGLPIRSHFTQLVLAGEGGGGIRWSAPEVLKPILRMLSITHLSMTPSSPTVTVPARISGGVNDAVVWATPSLLGGASLLLPGRDTASRLTASPPEGGWGSQNGGAWVPGRLVPPEGLFPSGPTTGFVHPASADSRSRAEQQQGR